jgi:hypothetical protein
VEKSLRAHPGPLALLAAVALAAAVGPACGGRPAVTPADGGSDQSDATPPAPPANQLDVLFVVDNSNTDFGDGPVAPLRLTKLLTPIAAAHPGLSVHVGIVTSDLGAGPFTPPSCDTVGGDQGRLVNTAWAQACTVAHLTDPGARFTAFTLTGDGAVADANFIGALDDVFDCYRFVGSGGCGFEHNLGAARAALDGCNTAAGCTQRDNVGFLRPDAYLLLVVLTTEDDCSAPADSTLFDPSQPTLNSPLGPLTSYRCFEFGVLCGGKAVGRQAGTHSGCAPGSKDPDPKHQLVPVETFARDLKALKASPRMVYAAVFAGPPGPVHILADANGFPDLQPSCGLGTGIWQGHADPAFRLEAFTRQLDADRGRFFDACTADADESFAAIGADLATALRGD